MYVRKKQESKVEIPTASMGDIAFLLLVFFMVTTVFNNEIGLQIILPEASTEAVKVKSKQIIHVAVDQYGKVKMEKEEVPFDMIKDKAKEMLIKDDGTPDTLKIFMIKTDRGANYEDMIAVFDQIKLAYQELQEKYPRLQEKISLAPSKKKK